MAKCQGVCIHLCLYLCNLSVNKVYGVYTPASCVTSFLYRILSHYRYCIIISAIAAHYLFIISQLAIMLIFHKNRQIQPKINKQIKLNKKKSKQSTVSRLCFKKRIARYVVEHEKLVWSNSVIFLRLNRYIFPFILFLFYSLYKIVVSRLLVARI